MPLFWERLVASGDVGTLIQSMDGNKFAHCHYYIIIPIFLFILHHSVLGFPQNPQFSVSDPTMRGRLLCFMRIITAGLIKK